MDKLTSEEFERLLAAEPLGNAFSESAADSPFLKHLTSIDRDLLLALMHEERYERGAVLCREGQAGDAMYLLWSGRVAVVKGSFASPSVLGYRGPGEVLGEMALLEDAPRSASLVAIEDVRLLRVERGGFEKLLSSSPALAMSIMASLSARLRRADDVRTAEARTSRRLGRQVSQLQSEKAHLLDLQRVRQETSDLIIHDLRNPLGIIFGALQLLEVVLPAEVLTENRELLDIANTAYRRMQRLIDSLLDIAKIEDTGVNLNLTEVPVPVLLRGAGEQLKLSLEAHGIQLRYEIPRDLPPISLDVERIERVLMNLLDNAIKYTPEGGEICLGVEAYREWMAFSVTDTGPGIPLEDRKRIFQRFAQVEGSSAQRRGYGLGLTFCQLAVEAHGGEIWVEPGPNDVGSRFVFTLPLAPAAEKAP